MSNLDIPTLVAGLPLWSKALAAEGRLGLLLERECGEVLCLGLTFLTGSNDAVLEFHPGVRRALGDRFVKPEVFEFDGRNVERLLSLSLVSPEFFVSAHADGFVNVLEPIDIAQAVGQDLLFVSGGESRACFVKAMTAGFQLMSPKTGLEETWFSAVEFASKDGSALGTSGDAGGVVFTRKGQPVALAFGQRDEAIFGIPLRRFLSRNEMRPLTAYSAARHNSMVQTLIEDGVTADEQTLGGSIGSTVEITEDIVAAPPLKEVEDLLERIEELEEKARLYA